MLQPRAWSRHSWPWRPLTTCNCLNRLSSHHPRRPLATATDQATAPSKTASSDSPAFAPSRDSSRTPKDTFAIRTYKPRTPGTRHLRRPINDHLWKGGPYRPLTLPKKGHGKGGRNNSGRIMVRHRGGGHKRRIRTLDYARVAPGKQLVERIERDPNRSAHIALLHDQQTQRKSYILAAEGMRAGDVIESYRSGIPQELLDRMGGVMDPGMLAARTAWRGNCLPMHMVPVGTLVYNVGSRPERGGVFCRSAGTFATVIAKDPDTERGEGRYVTVKLQSGEVRKVARNACATIGVASNGNHRHRQLGKAGRSRWLGIRPTVRGVAMNAVDHPHGGGRGKSKGNVHPVSIWGTPAKGGYKTRKKGKVNKFVVVARPRNHGKRRKAKNS
ncbi:MAG: hypothetical protein M1823_001744 [Watsoniomyces obsoletus]|nr:MAG: hypothetical protein M1823_001744 [Watsoniomyces obsoletus]